MMQATSKPRFNANRFLKEIETRFDAHFYEAKGSKSFSIGSDLAGSARQMRVAMFRSFLKQNGFQLMQFGREKFPRWVRGKFQIEDRDVGSTEGPIKFSYEYRD